MSNPEMEVICDMILNSDQFNAMINDKVSKAVDEYSALRLGGVYKPSGNNSNFQHTVGDSTGAGSSRTGSGKDALNRAKRLEFIAAAQSVQSVDEWGMPLVVLYNQTKKAGLITSLKPFVRLPRWADKSNFCVYHQEEGHPTNDCEQLKTEMRRLISAGKIRHPFG